ncbi:MAG: tetratricopeptide repeat protein [Vulcanimicrobiaceae bacterium]
MPSALEAILQTLDSVLAQWPRAVSLLFERARALDALKRDDLAEAAYLAVIAEDPRHFRALNDLGLLCSRHRLTNEAEKYLRAAVEADPKSAIGAANLAFALLERGDLAAAKTEFERALAIRPDNLASQRGLSDVSRRLGLSAPQFPAPEAAAAAAPPAAAVDPYIEYVYDLAANSIVQGENDAIRAFLERLLGRDPRYVGLLRRLANFASAQHNSSAARNAFVDALAIEPLNVELHIGLATVEEELGNTEAANAAWSSDLLRGAVRVFPYTGTEPPVRLLTIASALHAMRYELLIDSTVMQNVTLYTQAYAAGQALPEHDVVLVAVADVESDTRALEVARAIVARTGAPVLNHPDRVLRTSRTEQAGRLAALDDVVSAQVVSVPRDRLLAAGAALVHELGFSFPLLVRSPGFHNGLFFELVSDAGALGAAAATMPTDEVLLISYQDTRAHDGMIRKFRVMTIDGGLFPVHLAISPNWKVHYASSAMRDNPSFRREETRFLTDMTGFIGPRAVRALEQVAAMMDLDYGGIDFGFDPQGRVVVFEANGAMAIFTPDDDPRWDYRRAAIADALAAVKRMIVSRASAFSRDARG